MSQEFPPSAAPIRRIEDHFRSANGALLFRRSWLPADPQRVIVLAHGFGEHSGRYEHAGTWLAQRGCAVHAFDHQGHGRSPGPRGHVRRFDDYLDDLEILIGLAAGEHPGLFRILLGHSMGGLMAAKLAAERQPAVDCVATTGAGLLIAASGASRAKLLVARLLRTLLPRLAVDAGLPLESLSRDPEVVRRYLEDPYVDTHMTMSLAAEMPAATTAAMAAASGVAVPMLLLHGGDDGLCLPAGSQSFYRQLSVPGSDLRIYPGLRHEILNEPERESVLADLHRWALARQAKLEPAAVTA